MGKIKDILVQIKLNDPLLTKLNLQHSHITNENIIEITEALKLNTTITDIKLNFNYIGDIGAQALATFLNDNKKITSIELRNNNIGQDGIKAIANILKHNNVLKSLNLRSNNLYNGDENAQVIAEGLKNNNALTSINLRNNSITKVGAKALAEALTYNKTLTSINLRANSIDTEGLTYLSKALTVNQSLQVLNLHHNQLIDDDLMPLAKALEYNHSLTKLILSFNSCKDPDICFLAKALESNQTLTYLDLSYNSISDIGAEALINTFKNNFTLCHIKIKANNIKTKDYFTQIDELTKRNRKIAYFKNTIDSQTSRLLNSHYVTLDPNGNSPFENTETILKELEQLFKQYNEFLDNLSHVSEEFQNILALDYKKRVSKTYLIMNNIEEAFKDINLDFQNTLEVEFNPLLIKAHLINENLDAAYNQYIKHRNQPMNHQITLSLAEHVMGIENPKNTTTYYTLLFSLLESVYIDSDAQTLIRFAYAAFNDIPYQATNEELFGVIKVIPLWELKKVFEHLFLDDAIELILIHSINNNLDKFPPDLLQTLCQIKPLDAELKLKFGTSSITTFNHLNNFKSKYPISTKNAENLILFFDELIASNQISPHEFSGVLDKIEAQIQNTITHLKQMESTFFSKEIRLKRKEIESAYKAVCSHHKFNSINAFLNYKKTSEEKCLRDVLEMKQIPSSIYQSALTSSDHLNKLEILF